MNNSNLSIGEADRQSQSRRNASNAQRSQKSDYYNHLKIRETVYWTFFNKYIISLALIIATTYQFDFIGLCYFLLFFIHSFAYYSFRTSDEPIDVLVSFRGNKRNLRVAFKVLLSVISWTILALLIVARLIDKFFVSDSDNSLTTSDGTLQQYLDYYLNTMVMLVPYFDTLTTLCRSFLMCLLSLILERTYQLESEEAIGKTIHSQRTVDHITNVEGMKRYQVATAVSLIQDYKSSTKVNVLMQLKVLAFIAACATSVLNLPYKVIFILMCFVVTITGSIKSLKNASRRFNIVFLALLIVDLPTEYVVKGGRFFQTEAGEVNYFLEVFGFLSNLATYIEFYLKLALFLLLCQRIQYSYDCSQIYRQLKLAHSEKPDFQRYFIKRTPLAQRILQPISVFMVSITLLTFAIRHPCVIFIPLMPLCLYGFFLKQNEFKFTAKIFVFITGLYLIVTATFTLYYLLALDAVEKEEQSTFAEWLLGLEIDSHLYEKVFTLKYDYVQLLLLTIFSYFITKVKHTTLLQPHREAQEDDEVTLQDENLSESRSRLNSRHFNSRAPSQNRQHQIGDNISMENSQLDIVQEEHKDTIESAMPRYIKSTTIRNLVHKARDDTCKGKVSRFFVKVYQFLKHTFDQMVDMMIIHFSKISLCILFLVCVYKVNTFTAVLFVFFLILSLTSYKNIQRYWVWPTIINAFIIGLLYVVDVLRPTFITGLDSNTLLLVGITIKTNNHLSFTSYLPYMILLVNFVLTYYILNSLRYQQFVETYQLLESNDENIDRYTQMTLEMKKKTLSLQDPITKVIIKYSIYIFICALFLECAMLPISVLNFFLLSQLTAVLVKYLKYNTLFEMYKNLNFTMTSIKWVSFVFLFAKYMFQFEDYATKINMETEAEAMVYNSQLPLVYKLFGINNSHDAMTLFCLAIVMTLSNLQLKFLSYGYLLDILNEVDQEWNRLYFQKVKNQGKYKKCLHAFVIYFYFLIYHVLMPLPILFMIIYSECYISPLGFCALVFSLLTMIYTREQFWKYTYYLIGITTSILMLGVYGMQFVILLLPDYEGFINWLGIESTDDSESIIYQQLIPLFFILVICAFQKESLKSESLFVQTISDEQLKQEDNENSQNSESLDSLTHNEMKLVYQFEEPIRQCLKFRDYYLKQTVFMFGLIFLNWAFLIDAFWRRNIISIIYVMILLFILNVKYYPKMFEESLDQKLKREKVALLLKITIWIISIVMGFEYVMLISSPTFFSFTKWKDYFAQLLCFSESQDCVVDWEDWLQLAFFSPSTIYVDFYLLVVTYINLLFASGQINMESLLLPYPQVNDKNDFLQQNYKKFQAFLLQCFYNGFPYILIAFYIIFAATFGGSSDSDLISLLYMCTALYYLLHFRKLYTLNTKMLDIVRKFNFIVLFALLLFQAPFFICPVVNQTDSTYISTEQCQYYSQFSQDVTNSNASNLLAIYIVVTESLGLQKLYSIRYDFIAIIILTEIQNHIFTSPYFQVYVLEHMKQEKETDGRLRAFMLVERSHLQSLWSYKAIKEEIKILHQRLLRIMQTVRQDEHSAQLLAEDGDSEFFNETQHLLDSNSSQNDSLSLAEIQSNNNDSQQIELSKTKEEKIKQILDQHAPAIEHLAMTMLWQEDAPIVPLRLYETALRNYIQNHQNFELLDKDGDSLLREHAVETYLMEVVKKLQRQVHLQNRIDLYNKEGIGLYFSIKKGSDVYLKEGDYAFFNNLILDKVPNSSLDKEESSENFEVKNEYEDIFLIKDKYKEVIKSEASFMTKFDFYLRSTLWTHYVDKLLFYSLTYQQQEQLTVQDISYRRLIWYAILSQSRNICFIAFFNYFIQNADLISVFLPITTLFYGMIDNPFPTVKYWKFLMIYMFVVIVAKFIYQLPVFCSTPAYTLYSNDMCVSTTISSTELLMRIDYIIGIHKFSGGASYPRDEGIFYGILPDIIVMITLLLHKNYLYAIGVWHYIRTKQNIYQNPSFKCRLSEMSEQERLEQIKKDNYRVYEYEQSSFFGKVYLKSKSIIAQIQWFVLRLLPQYMDQKQKNLDMRHQAEEPYITHNVKKVKGGKDYFSAIFYSLLLLLFYNLLFYSTYTTDSDHAAALSSINFERFQIPQVILLFCLLMIMMLDRMLFRMRTINSSLRNANQSLMGKHQLTIKVLLHIILVVIIHVYYGFVTPRKNQYFFFEKASMIIAYIFWVIYFVSSAQQIKYGYPQAPFRQPFTQRDTQQINQWIFRTYRAIPLLWEMKVVIDWTVTTTCLDLFSWFKLDDAYNYLYYNAFINRNRRGRPEYAQRPWWEKFFQGFCFAFGLIIIIILPIIIFSGIAPIMQTNPVKSAQVQIYLELSSNNNTYNILETQAYNIVSFTDNDVSSLSSLFVPTSIYYDTSNMQKLYFSPYSDYDWTISPPSLQKFINDFQIASANENSTVTINAYWSFDRDYPSGYETASMTTSAELSAADLNVLVELLQNRTASEDTLQNATAYVADLFPKLVELGSTSTAAILEATQVGSTSIYSSTNLTLNIYDTSTLFWTYKLSDTDEVGIFNTANSQNTSIISDSMVVVVYNEEVIVSTLSSYNLSVIGLYATIVIAVGSFIRLIFDRISQRVIYEEMTDTEKIFEICEGIYIAQLEGDLPKEKRFFDLLIRMYRSPETLLKVTGVKLHYPMKYEGDQTSQNSSQN